MSDCTCYSNSGSMKRECPICHTPGQSVPFETVKSLAKNPALLNRKDMDFFICLTPDCETVYFGHDVVFGQKDIIVPVSFKTGASPKFLCYCNRITEDEIIRAIVDGGAKTISDIARLTGAMKNGNCIANNPKGACCHKDIEAKLKQVLESR